MNKYVSGLLVTDIGWLPIVRKSHPEWQKGFGNLPGGTIRPYESALEAIVREWKEETGMSTFTRDWHARIEVEGQTFHHTIFQYRHKPVQMGKIIGRPDEPVDWQRLSDMLIPETYRPKILGLPPLVPDLYYLIPLALDQNVQGTICLRDRR